MHDSEPLLFKDNQYHVCEKFNEVTRGHCDNFCIISNNQNFIKTCIDNFTSIIKKREQIEVCELFFNSQDYDKQYDNFIRGNKVILIININEYNYNYQTRLYKLMSLGNYKLLDIIYIIDNPKSLLYDKIKFIDYCFLELKLSTSDKELVFKKYFSIFFNYENFSKSYDMFKITESVMIIKLLGKDESECMNRITYCKKNIGYINE